MDWPDDLILELARKRCVLFLGSGISANATDIDGNHPPTWRKFLEEVNSNDGAPDIALRELCIYGY